MEIPLELIRLAKKQTGSLESRMNKLTEEVGELAEQILIKTGEKEGTGDAQKDQYNLHLEAIDVILMAMSILVITDYRTHELPIIMDGQLVKWEEWIDKKASK